jgi:hypothetical protein
LHGVAVTLPLEHGAILPYVYPGNTITLAHNGPMLGLHGV